MRGEAGEDTQAIVLSRLIRDPKYQVRQKLDQPTINRYVEVLKMGGTMPPIEVALVNDGLLLLDGWHRIEAMEALGWREAEAIVSKATEEKAYWLAAKANLKHGLPLKRSERRGVFKAYVNAGQHKKNRRSFKSYREMQDDLGIPFSTVRSWMQKDFRHIAAKIGGDDAFQGKGGLRDRFDPSPVHDRLDEAYRVFQSTADAEARGAIINRLDLMLADMKQAGNWKMPPPPPPSDF